jgi:hypothetical protein
MPHPWNSLISCLSEITRENCNSIIYCSHCGNRHTYVKWGFYTRYLFDDSLINIQRYRCDNDLCPRKTFSILPHALLPILRISLCMFMFILKKYEQGNSIACIARETDSDWPKIQRWIARALSIRSWIGQEYAASPCLSAGSKWLPFTRDFSWAFYPDRFR